MEAVISYASFMLLCCAGQQVSLVTSTGDTPGADDGSDVAAVLLHDPATEQVTRLERNESGTFFRIFQANKWVLKKKAEAAAAKAATLKQAVQQQPVVAA